MARFLRQFLRLFSNKMDPQKIQNNVSTSNNTISLQKSSVNGLTNRNQNPLVLKTTDPTAAKIATEQLQQGNVIAVPTDTVYGLSCNANDPIAIQKLYEIKGRNNQNPVAICVANISDLKHYGQANHLPDDLLKLLLPGAVTIVLKKSKNLNNPYLNPGIAKIAIRIPNLDFIRNISAQFPYPIALTSANRSTEKSTLSIDEFKVLWPKLGAIFDGGRVGLTEEQRAASTIVDLSNEHFYKITRNGVAIQQTVKILEMFGLKPSM